MNISTFWEHPHPQLYSDLKDSDNKGVNLILTIEVKTYVRELVLFFERTDHRGPSYPLCSL